jgi:electron transport complex protein RnfD
MPVAGGRFTGGVVSTSPQIATGAWCAAAAPHRFGGATHDRILRAWTFGASIVAVGGIVFFGIAAAKVIAVSILTAIGADWIVAQSRGRPVIGGFSHAVLTGLLLALTLPATIAWYVPFVGAAVSIVIGKALFGGLGHYLWQPALLGRVVVQIVFLNSLTLGPQNPSWPVLGPKHLVTGSLSNGDEVELHRYPGWFRSQIGVTDDALKMPLPSQSLRRFADGRIPAENSLRYEPFVRDWLPPWEDTVIGLVPGGIGETGTLAIIVAGLYLIYRGYLRWQLPVAMIATAALAAALLPIQIADSGGQYDWFPVFADENGRAVGLAYVFYHLTSGGLMLGAFLLAGDMIATPMRGRGQVIFAACIGAMTIFLRLYGVLACACYWSILVMNMFVPAIDRGMKRPILGIEPEAP